jgi:hypothetical protein
MIPAAKDRLNSSLYQNDNVLKGISKNRGTFYLVVEKWTTSDKRMLNYHSGVRSRASSYE